MATSKYYAVRKGKKTGIFLSWEECKTAVAGFSGAEYKSFKIKEEAIKYLDGATNTIGADQPNANSLLSYVDGSYDNTQKKYAFGCVFITPENMIYTENGGNKNPDSALLRNVTGEMLGAMYAVRWALRSEERRVGKECRL